MNIITQATIEEVSKKNLVCLRDVKTGRLLNVSFSEEGLKWTISPQGKLIYFKKANIKRIHNSEYRIVAIEPKGNLTMSEKVFVEPFVPRNSSNAYLQAAEYAGIHKAYKLWYNVAETDQSVDEGRFDN